MFGKRYNIFSVAGINIGVDLSWFFIAIFLSWTLAISYFPIQYPHLSKATYWLMGILGMLGLFACIVLHELGHAAVARYYKLPISQITLFIFGGMAEIQKEPSSPKIEFLMAIAGPVVSFILAFTLYFMTQLAHQFNWTVAVGGVTAYLATVNFILALFNLIPAFPLDGGRVLRAILWWGKKNLAWATRISTFIGSSFGFCLIFFGIFNFIIHNFLAGFWLVILGWFLHKAASSMRTQFYMGKELEGERVSKFMKTDIVSVAPTMSIKEFVEQFVYISHHHVYPVTLYKKLLGYISLQEVKALPHPEWGKTAISSIMVKRTQFEVISPHTSALEALALFQRTQLSILFIVENDLLIGLLTAQDLFKVISLKLELEEEMR